MFYRSPSAAYAPRVLRLNGSKVFAVLLLSLLCLGSRARAQEFGRELDTAAPVELRVKNRTGRVTVVAEDELKKVSIRATSAAGLPVTERDVRVTQSGASVTIDVEREQSGRTPGDGRKVTLSPAQIERERIDLVVRVPSRSRVSVETEAGAVDVVGNVSEAEAKTDTGTIRADVPLDALRYSFRWTLSRPRFFSEVELPKVKTKRGGDSEISGRFGEKKAKKDERIRLDLETARGVVLQSRTRATSHPTCASANSRTPPAPSYEAATRR